MGPPRFELKSIAPEVRQDALLSPIRADQIDEYMALRKLNGICDRWFYQTEDIITKYLEFVGHKIDLKKTLKYIQDLKDNLSLSTYRKRTYAIRKFLKFLNVEWANQLHPPPEQKYIPIHVPQEQIIKALEYFKDSPYYLQVRALIHLGKDSGARAEELYQLTLEDIDLDNRSIHIIHNPKIGKTTKNKVSRISFFTPETKKVLEEYIAFYNNGFQLRDLFGQSHLTRLFRPSPIKIKLLRKFFSQQWTRRDGNSSVKAILMGHSVGNNVDLQHYNYQSPGDLKRIYDRVMLNHAKK
jgi:integrase/recombinase XerD